MPGPSDGAQRERERFWATNTVSGLPLLSWPISASCQWPKTLEPRASGTSQLALKTQLCLAW
jgi:hypothetical protein